jgi:hypothetical protein
MSKAKKQDSYYDDDGEFVEDADVEDTPLVIKNRRVIDLWEIPAKKESTDETD